MFTLIFSRRIHNFDDYWLLRVKQAKNWPVAQSVIRILLSNLLFVATRNIQCKLRVCVSFGGPINHSNGKIVFGLCEKRFYAHCDQSH
jgi:hypothetical protein